jgi:hypothetical protein
MRKKTMALWHAHNQLKTVSERGRGKVCETLWHWACKGRTPYGNVSVIADLISRIESVQNTDAILDKLDSRKFGDTGMFGPFFGNDDD